MSLDKLVDSTQLDSDLESVADAIRAKGGTSASLAFPAGFVSAVEAIPTGGGGSQLTFLGKVETSQNVRSMAVTLDSAWLAYDYFVMKCDISLTGLDWIYFSPQDTTGGVYTAKVTAYHIVNFGWPSPNLRFNIRDTGNNSSLLAPSNNTFYVYTYTASVSIVAGSAISIYGGYYADL